MSEQINNQNRLSKEEAAALIKAIEEVEREEATKHQRSSASDRTDAGDIDRDASKAA